MNKTTQVSPKPSTHGAHRKEGVAPTISRNMFGATPVELGFKRAPKRIMESTVVATPNNFMSFTAWNLKSCGGTGTVVSGERFVTDDNLRVLPPTDCVRAEFRIPHYLSTAEAVGRYSHGCHLKKISEMVPEANYIWMTLEPLVGGPIGTMLLEAYQQIHLIFVRHMCSALENIYGRFFNAVRDSRKKLTNMSAKPGYEMIYKTITNHGTANWYDIFLAACSFPVNMVVEVRYVEKPTTASNITDLNRRQDLIDERDMRIGAGIDTDIPVVSTNGSVTASGLFGETADDVVAGVKATLCEVVDEAMSHEWDYYTREFMEDIPLHRYVFPRYLTQTTTSSDAIKKCKVYADGTRNDSAMRSAYIVGALYFISQASIADIKLIVKDSVRSKAYTEAQEAKRAKYLELKAARAMVPEGEFVEYANEIDARARDETMLDEAMAERAENDDEIDEA